MAKVETAGMRTDRDYRAFQGPGNAVRYTLRGYGDGLLGRGGQLQRSDKDNAPRDGAVMLGRDSGGGAVYPTRYWIKHPSDRRQVCVRTMHEQCVPCCIPSYRKSWCYTVWLVLRSETLLFILHTAALTFGVVKEVLNMKDTAPSKLIMFSVLETFCAYVVLIIRLIVAWERFVELRHTAYAVEYVKPDQGDRLRALYWWLRGVIATGITLIILNAILFIVFFFALDRQLGWTVLTNQFLLLLVTAMSSLFLARRNKILYRAREDQHKVVLYEAVLLLNETFSPQTQNDVNRNYSRVKLFLQTLYDTPLFDPPSRIHLDKRHKQQQQQQPQPYQQQQQDWDDLDSTVISTQSSI